MGRTVPAIALEFQRQQKAFEGFRRALKRSDKLIGRVICKRKKTYG